MFRDYMPWNLFKAEQDKLTARTAEEFHDADKRAHDYAFACKQQRR